MDRTGKLRMTLCYGGTPLIDLQPIEPVLAATALVDPLSCHRDHYRLRRYNYASKLLAAIQNNHPVFEGSRQLRKVHAERTATVRVHAIDARAHLIGKQATERALDDYRG